MARLVLGPLLRWVGVTDATVWVEADAPCEVEILGAAARTFHVEGHHYALVHVEGLTPGAEHPYEVRLDGSVVWPPQRTEFPPSAIRTRPQDGGERYRLLFGSCRVAAPHRPPWTLPRMLHREGRGQDALLAYALRMRDLPSEEWPDAFLLLGDQVYADDASPRTRAYIRTRRDTTRAPWEQVADFEEYTVLYREAWSEPWIRWLLSTVPTAMIFDDHDITDDWNISAEWVAEMRRKEWWHERIVGGLVSYWIYQHVGNLSPAELATDALFRRVQEVDDAGPLLREFAEGADRDTSTARWSFERDCGPARLVVVDSRAGRVLGDGRRDMLDAAEWEWLEERLLRRGTRHLLVGTSLPLLLAPGIDALEAWSEAVSAGAWGRRAAQAGEGLRRAIDLEHWAAFRDSFHRLGDLLRGAASGAEAPRSVVVLSGDVHHTYLADVDFPGAADITSRVYQAVASPMRNTVDTPVWLAFRFALSRPGTAIGRWLARSSGVVESPIRWRIDHPPVFDNLVSVLDLDGDTARLRVEAVTGLPAGRAPYLRTVLDRRLA